MKLSKHVTTIALLTIASGLAPVGPASAQSQEVRVGILMMAALTNPWVAEEEGIFDQHGLDVELIEFRAGAEAVAATQAGDVDIILAIPGTAMTAIERGFDLVAIIQNETAKAETPDTASMQVLVDSDITSLADLTGKTVAMSSLFSQNSVAAMKLISDAGVDLETVQFVEIPLPSQIDVLRAGQVDVAVVVDPYTTQLQTMGLGRILAWTNVETIPEQPLGVWYARRSFVEANPELVENFAAAIKDSIDYMNADVERARAKVAEFTGLDPALVADMPLINWTYDVKLDRWQSVIEMMAAMDLISPDHDVMEYFTDQILSYVVE